MYIEETAYDTSVNRSTEYSKSSRQFFSLPVLRVYTFSYQIKTYIQRKWPQGGVRRHEGGGGEREKAVAQSVERATSGEEVPGSIPAVTASSLLVGSVSV